MGGVADAFATKINAAGSALVYSTYLGGSQYDQGAGIAVDTSGNAYLTGTTRSTNFPTAGPIQAANGGFDDAFATKINAARSRALRDVAENYSLQQQEFNRAFVLMQFFGYLRRNPNDPQDTDYTGYEFWLNKLNQFNGNFVAAEMVKAFITSVEYRQRFGP